MPSDVIESVDVAVAPRVAYAQWTRFEELPLFMDDVDEVRRLGPGRMRWSATIDGVHEEWDAVVTEQRSDERVAWQADGKGMAGLVTFQPLDEGSTRVSVRMSWEPHGAAEKVGAALGVDGSHVRLDLQRFKELIEREGVGDTGAELHAGAEDRVGSDRSPASPADASASEDRARMPARPGEDADPPPTW